MNDTGARSPRSRRGRLLSASVAVLVSVYGCAGAAPSEAPATIPGTASAAPSTAPSDDFMALPAQDGPLEAGGYRVPVSPWSAAAYTVTVPDGWSLQYGQIFNKHADSDREFGFYPVLVDSIYADACLGSNGDEVETGSGVDELTDALARQRGPRVSDTPTNLGGFDGTLVQMSVPEGFDLSECNAQDIGLQVWYSRPADKYFVLLADAEAGVYVLDIAGERQVFLTQVGSAATKDDRAELQAILDSIRIEP